MLKDCQVCSIVSKASGEDPIGTASTCDQWLLIESPQPWSMEQWQQDPVIRPIVALLETLIGHQGMKLRPLAIAPDTAYSQPGHSRVLYYQRPADCFSQYEKQEYLVPTAQVYGLTVALLQAPERLSEFAAYRQTVATRDLLVCTHANVDVACGRFGNPIYTKLRKEYADQVANLEGSEQRTTGDNSKFKIQNSKPHPPSPDSSKALRVAPLNTQFQSPQLRVWRCSHFGGHRFAPTMIDLPTGQYFGHLEMAHLDALVYRRGDCSQLRSCYRGWAGLSRFEQMAEREIWMRLGWSWLSYAKAGQTLDQDPAESPTWATVQIEFQSPEGGSGTCKAEIELTGEVETLGDSGMELFLMKQYRVSHLMG